MAESMNLLRKNFQRKNLFVNLTLVLAGVFLFLPLISATEFSLRDGGSDKHSLISYKWIIEQDGFLENLGITMRVMGLAVVLTLILMVPTVTWLHLSGQRYKKLLEVLTMLPLIIPVVALATGAQLALPTFVHGTVYELSFLYVVISMPYTYRALDIGMSSKPLATLVAAAKSLGASWLKVMTNVIIPTILPSMFAALFMTITLSLGEFTLAQLLHWTTFPTWITNVSQQNILGATALAVGTLVFAWALLYAFTFLDRNNSQQIVEEE
jgi:putative spermidine/putrescine transport system permease protein